MYKRERRSSVYLINLYNEHESFQKVGTTVHRLWRFKQIMKHGYSCRVLCQVRGLDMSEAYAIESAIKRAAASASYTPNIWFGGYTECFIGIDPLKFRDLILSNVESYTDVIENIIID